jgi:hypothetical protein
VSLDQGGPLAGAVAGLLQEGESKLASLLNSGFKQASQRRSSEFDPLVAPLEAMGDENGPKRLNGPGLGWCVDAFNVNPDGFAVCCARALEAGGSGYSRSPLGLLCRMVRDGEHRITTTHGRRPRDARPRTRSGRVKPLPPCPECGVGGREDEHATDCPTVQEAA